MPYAVKLSASPVPDVYTHNRDDKERAICGEAKADYIKRVRHERGLRDE